MNIKPIKDQPASDDQELAKVLAGVDKQVTTMSNPNELQFEEAPANQDAGTNPPAADAPVVDSTSDDTNNASVSPFANPDPVATAAPAPSTVDPIVTTPPAADTTSTAAPLADPNLEAIKKDALSELRPLVTKLDIPADEKFDTILLIIRSTDDQSLLGAAHDAAKAITDETKRAEALLDIIKEIDYFGKQHAA